MKRRHQPNDASTLLFPLALLLVASAGGCEKEQAPATAPAIRPVRTLEIKAGGGGKLRRFSGVTQSSMESKLSFKVSGSIKTLKVKVGQRVKKGQLIAEVDDRDLKLQVQQAQAAYAQARAQVVNARATYTRVQKLYEASSASRADLDSARAAHASARASAGAAAKQIQLARSQLAYTRLKAPGAGAISMVTAEVGENTSPGRTIAVLSSGARPEVNASVPEAFIGQIKQGAAAKVTLSALPGKTFDAVVTEVGVTAAGMGATYAVIATIKDPPAELRAGMAAELAFELAGKAAASSFSVPPVAVGQDSAGRFVYIAEPAGEGKATVRRRAVKVGELSSAGLELLSGLKVGDLLITAGVSKIRDGLEVKLMPGVGGK